MSDSELRNPSIEDRVAALEDLVTSLTATNKSLVAAVKRLRRALAATEDELDEVRRHCFDDGFGDDR